MASETILISEPVVPVPGAIELAGMASGLPGLPTRFVWRGKEYAIARVLDGWKGYGYEGTARYLRRHWLDVLTESGERMTLYCERQPRSARRAKSRWFLYTIGEGEKADD